MRDPPRVVRHKQDRVQNPSDGVVDLLALGKGLVTTFVGDDPETGSEETHPDRDRGVDDGSGELVSGVREVATGESSRTSQPRVPRRRCHVDLLLTRKRGRGPS
jgi:hypothetical protein